MAEDRPPAQPSHRQYWTRPTAPPPRPPVSKRRYAVAVVLGAAVALASAEALYRIVGSVDARIAGYALGIFSAGWNTRARTVRSWIIVGLLTVAAVWAAGLAGVLVQAG